MSIHRHAAKRDANEREIIATWKRLGCWVESVSSKGTPDTRVHFDGHTFRAEVKGAKRGLTESQLDNFTDAHKHGVPTYVVRTPAEAVMLLEDTLEPWKPKDGALAGAARTAREHKPGASKARSLSECCTATNCVTSRLAGRDLCKRHASILEAAMERCTLKRRTP